MDKQSVRARGEAQSFSGGDADCLQRARAGNRIAFCQLVQEHQKRVFSIALRLTGQRADAEDLAQDTFMQLHASLSQISSPAHLKHWLIRTVSHRAIDLLRRDTTRGKSLHLESIPDGEPEHGPDGRDDPLAAAHLQRLLLVLEPDARAVVLLHYQQDLTAAEIATALDMPVNTVKSHLRRSIEWLRTQCVGENHGS